MLKTVSQHETPLKSFYGLLKFISRNIRSLSALKPRSLIPVLCLSKDYRNFRFMLQALASVLSVAAQMKEAMVELEEGSARSQVLLFLSLSFLQSHF